MTEPIFIGARGWDCPDGCGGFYPEILPDDWRLGFYANRLRAVLLSAATWSAATAPDVRAWAEDVFPEFRFVVEVPAETPALWPRLEPLRAQIAGLLLRTPATPTADWLAAHLAELTAVVPVCVDLPAGSRTPALEECLLRHGAGRCWYPATEPAPRPGGRLLVALADTAAPRTLRHWLEALAAWQGQEGLAALFFDNPETAEQARVLAELMAV